MESTNPGCVLRCSSSSGASSSRRSLDSQTALALNQLKLQAEEVALELAARLRVLGKSLATACKGPRSAEGKPSAYAGIRRQLDAFLGSLLDGDLAGRYLPVICDYLQQNLPPELNACGGANACRIVMVESAISLLSECACEEPLIENHILEFSSLA